MDLAHSSIITTNGVIFLRILIRYGSHALAYNERGLRKIFNTLVEALDSLIFVHEDIYISNSKPKLAIDQVKRLVKKHMSSLSISEPLVFQGHFNLDFNPKDVSPRAEIRSPPQNRTVKSHHLKVDALFSITADELESNLCSSIQDQVKSYLTAYLNALVSILHKENTLPRSLTAYYFRYENQLIRVFYPPARNNETELRQELHRRLGLPQQPILRRGLALFPSRSFRRLLGPNDENLVSPHLLLPSSAADRSSNGTQHSCEIIRGRYTYKHYLQDGIDDKNWGCAYRSLQTLASWLLWQGLVSPLRPLPSHREIQETLVRVGDKQANFIGSRQWIGSLEVSFCLEDLYGVQCRLLPVSRGRDFGPTAAAVLTEHFAAGGGPVMVGGGQLAHTIVGVSIAPSVDGGDDATRYLVLDPHYTGQPGHAPSILGKGWVGWKEENFWKPDVPYNLCFLPSPERGIDRV